jgi:dTDP-4-dehydrorhamnose reductase
MKHTVLLTGANGLLGQKITQILSSRSAIRLIATSKGINRNPEFDGYEYETVDITDFEKLQSVFYKYRPTEVINSAAMTNVDACELNPEETYKLNVTAVRNLCGLCKEFDTRLIHISTDFIFDGEAGPYTEKAIPNPLSTYGKSKLEAEKIIESSHIRAAIIRTVLLYGVVPDISRTNIVLWVRKNLLEGKEINVVTDQWRTPTLAEDLADGVVAVLLKNKTGIYNISGNEFFSIYDFAVEVAKFFKLDTNLIKPILSQNLSQPAKRPPKTGFIILKAQTELNYSPHSLSAGLELVKRQLASYNL